jgi:hypothetical protein
MKLFAVKELYESFARAGNAERSDADRRKVNRAFTSKVMGLVKDKQLDISSISFRELWEALVVAEAYRQGVEVEEVVHSTAFPNISGEILSQAMIEGYNAFPTDANSLVRIVPSNMKVETSAGWTAIGAIRPVKEAGNYEEVEAPDEKIVLTDNNKHGGICSLTREAIKFDRTAQLVGRARDIGTEAARYRSQLILEGVIDKNANVYNRTTLYSSGNSNLNTGAGSALGTAGFEAADLALMNQTDEQGNPIWVLGDRPVLMVPTALKATAWKLQNNDYGPAGTALGNDKNYAQNKFDIVVNPYQTTATRWHYGAFKRQFVWFEVWPMETYYRVGQDHEDGFVRDVVLQAKAGFFGGVGALDTKYVNQNNGA